MEGGLKEKEAMKDALIPIALLIILIVVLIYACKYQTEQHIAEVKVSCDNAAEISRVVVPNGAGQFVEAVDEGELRTWIASHRNDRRIVALTGIGTGSYGRDDVFIVVSEPVVKEKP